MSLLNHHLKPPEMERLEAFFKKRLKGQPQAIAVLAEAYAAYKSGIGKFNDHNNKKPIGIFLFLGESRTGKTHAGRILAEFLHGTRDAVTFIPCVNFQEKQEVAKLIGAPPGYVGYGDKIILSKEQLCSKIHGYQNESLADEFKSSKQGKKDKDQIGIRLGALGTLSETLTELQIIDQALKNVRRELYLLKEIQLSEQELKKTKDDLYYLEAFLNFRRSLVLNSYLSSIADVSEYSEDGSPTITAPTILKTKPQKSKAISIKIVPEENPIFVIIFDEIEKAHESVRQFLLQLMEEGRAYLGNGEEVDLSRAFIILTSNLGSNLIGKLNRGIPRIGFTSQKITLNRQIKSELKKFFKIEFLNRLDAVVTFNTLSEKDFQEILEIQIEEFSFYLKKRSLYLTITQPVRDLILQEITKNPEEQVKALHDCFKKYLMEPIGNLISTEQLKDTRRITAILKAGQVIFEK